MHVHRRPGLSSSGAQRLSAPPGWTTVSTLCRWPDAKVACGCTAQRRARSLASGARRACPGWPLSGTSDFTEGDWVGVKRCQTYLRTRLDELYTAMAAQNCLRPSCDHAVFLQYKYERTNDHPAGGPQWIILCWVWRVGATRAAFGPPHSCANRSHLDVDGAEPSRCR